jgi:hypothetical protein
MDNVPLRAVWPCIRALAINSSHEQHTFFLLLCAELLGLYDSLFQVVTNGMHVSDTGRWLQGPVVVV